MALPLLALQPGKLTREYIDGRRASYVSPIALFLFVVFLTFAVFNATGGNAMKFDSASIKAGTDQAARDAKDDNRDQMVKDILEKHARNCEITLIGEFEEPEWVVLPPQD